MGDSTPPHALSPWIAWSMLFLVARPGLASEEEILRYSRDIRPILSDRCFVCHGPDVGTRAGKLRLDKSIEATADRGGYAAIVPGNIEESELWARITSPYEAERMPPADSNKKPLSEAEQELVRRWIEGGARYEEHWAFVPPARPELSPQPAAHQHQNPIDRFLSDPLEQRGLAMSAVAAPETLLRRLFLDLTGLPPTPEELAGFLANPSEQAYATWIDRIFHEEPYRSRYAEHMATPWLDAARYADTSGIHTDAGRQIWLWRDWVLDAYRQNMPFDRFVTEQIAGDLLPNATQEQRIASGFHRNHVTTDEGGAIDEEYLVEYAVDRTATTGSVFLGLTLGCARCHEHKFDPISQEEFYQLYAFFNSIEEPGLYSQLPDPKRAFEPFIEVPNEEQSRALEHFAKELERLHDEQMQPSRGEEATRQAFVDDVRQRADLRWIAPAVIAASSVNGATLSIQSDGSVLASGENPARDVHEIRLETEAMDLSLLCLEALTDASLPGGSVGRAFNGNAVLTGLEAVAISLRDPAQRQAIQFQWVWANHEQADGNYAAVNVLEAEDDLGWAVDAHRRGGGRVLLLLAEKEFGFEGGTRLELRLEYDSVYEQHTFGRVRLSLAQIAPEGRNLLPVAQSGWHLAGPFAPQESGSLYEQVFGPELALRFDRTARFGSERHFWQHDPAFRDGAPRNFGTGPDISYLGREFFVPSARELELSLGSDDGFQLYLNGREIAAERVDRALAPDQNRLRISLPAGRSLLVVKVVNSGGPAGFYYRALARAQTLGDKLVAVLLPEDRVDEGLAAEWVEEWRITESPSYRAAKERILALESERQTVLANLPKTMVMRERAMPRDTYLLMRGVYSKPDTSRKLERDVPRALGSLPEGAPRDRRGLAQWLISPENPLVARVAANRMWERLFGTGIVSTSEDFGLQGEWPSHPDLLDWLAVEFRESGWDVQHMLRLMLTSVVYRQNSRVRPEVLELDPENRWLSYFPRRRLSAEEIRDQALFASGLLVERLGGPSVKPYQPDGLWQEVAMPASNTRFYERGSGVELWRRSLYTYWKRACPPPSLMTFDAPTREFCTIRRASTNTPLQAFVLWNDEQFVEAARALASRSLRGRGSDEDRLALMYQRCTSRQPSADELRRLQELLAYFRARYEAAPDDAVQLVQVGESLPDPALDTVELAAWTMIANALFSLDATLTRS